MIVNPKHTARRNRSRASAIARDTPPESCECDGALAAPARTPARLSADSGSPKTHHSRPAAAGPEKAAVASIKCFDPFRGYLLYLLDEISLGNSSGQRGDDVNVINHTADADKLRTKIAADCGHMSMHAALDT